MNPGHLLCRFPDMYDYGRRDGDFEESHGIGVYCLMGSGNHLNRGRTPSPVCGYLRDLIGWADNQVILSNVGTFEIQDCASGTAKGIKVSVDISHTYRGDLLVELVAPSGRSVTLHNREGGSKHDLRVMRR